jgi:uncharacterized protein involved in outer membrane biogenesis
MAGSAEGAGVGRWAWWLTAIAILVALPGLAVGIGAVVVDPNDYKAEIVQAVQNATGRTLRLNGPVRFSLSLWPTIDVSDVTLANLPGGTRPDIARAERIEARLSLPALLWHRIEVIKLTLVGPNILFEEVQGKPNWVFSPPAPAASASAAPSGTPYQLRIREVYVRNGMVTWRLPARTKVVGIRTLGLQHHEDGGPLAMDAVLVYSDNQPFSLRASAQPTAGPFGPWTTQLTFAAFDTKASAAGTMDVAGNYDLQVEATAGAVERLNALLPEMRLPMMHRATLSTHLMNGPVPGDLPVVGATRLHFEDADLGDRVRGLKLSASDVSLSTPGGSATVVSAGQFAGQTFTLNGIVSVPMYPDARTSLAFDLSARAVTGREKAASGDLAIKGKMTLDALRFGGIDTAVALRTPALAAIRPMLWQRLPSLTDVRFDGRLIVPADGGSVSFSEAKLRAREGDVAGEGRIGLGATMALNTTLRSARLDLNATLTAFGVDPGTVAASAGTTGSLIPATPLPWTALSGPAIDLSGSVDTLTFQGRDWQRVELALQLKNGRMSVGTLKLALPEGPLEVSMATDVSVEPVPVSLVVHAPSVPLSLIASYAGLVGKVDGTMRIDAQLKAAGLTARDLAASLDGSIFAYAAGGQLSNADFVKLTSAALEALGIDVPAKGETTLRCLGLAGSLAKGVGRFKTIALETTYLSLGGVGQVDLGQETMALKLNPLARISGSPVSVPVVIEGPFRALNARLDADCFDKVGLFIDALFGGDHPDTCSDAGLIVTRSKGR